MANIYRDVTLQNVSENDIGKQMKVSGWVEKSSVIMVEFHSSI